MPSHVQLQLLAADKSATTGHQCPPGQVPPSISPSDAPGVSPVSRRCDGTSMNPDDCLTSSSPLDDQSETTDDNIFNSCKLTVGGDWMWVAALLGTSGPNGKFFCNSCLVVTTDMPPGKPHACSILPKYQNATGGLNKVVPDDTEFYRSFDGCASKNAQYIAAGEKKADAQKYNNCVNPPLLTGPELVIDTISTSPLHINLGLGLHVLNIVEKKTVELDKQMKEAEGEYSEFEQVYKHRRDILKKCQTLNSKIETITDKINDAKKRKIEIIKERATFFKKNKNGNFIHNTDLAKGVRTRFDNLGKAIKGHETEKDKVKKTLKSKEKDLSKVQASLEEVKGPFKSRFDAVLAKLSLKRAAYHSGSLIGPDVKKLATYSNIEKFANIFTPIKVRTVNREEREFSSHAVWQQISTLLTKFAQCYELYNKNRTLCAHEVEVLAMRCASFGCWFPINFKTENLKRKFHVLTVEVPCQARRLLTIGMLTEQTIESLHPYMNKLDRMFCTVQDAEKRAVLKCRQQAIFSTPSVPHLK